MSEARTVSIHSRQNVAVRPAHAASDDDEVVRVLQNSLYPGAKDESVRLVLAYCRFNKIDPMLKPVHIVPTSIKIVDQGGRERWEKRDVLMPGIADYRIKASRSGEYAGISEPEFGPDREFKNDRGDAVFTYPEWCKITVFRLVGGQPRPFPAKEYWLENYATAGRDNPFPNTMWRKRPYGQISKVAEAQALRKAFPEFGGGTNTSEEMEGRHLEGPVIEGRDAEKILEDDREVGSKVGVHAVSDDGFAARVAGVLRAVSAAPDLAGLAKVEGKASQLLADLNDSGSSRLLEDVRNGIADRRQALTPATEPPSTEPPHQPDSPTAKFETEIYLADGSALEDDGRASTYSDPVAFAAALTAISLPPETRAAVIENNLSAIEIAMAISSDAAQILEPLMNQRDTGEHSQEKNSNPLLVPVPRADGTVKAQEYAAACRTAILALRDDQIEEWKQANEPNYRDMGSATKTAIARAFQERHAPEAPSPATEDASSEAAAQPQGDVWDQARDLAAQFAECKWRGDLDELTRNAAIIAKVRNIKAAEPKAGAWINDQYKAAWARFPSRGAG